MIDAVRTGFRHAVAPVVVGAGIGAIVGWSGVFVYTSAERVAAFGGTLYTTLFILLPLTIAGMTLVAQRRTPHLYAEARSAVIVLLTAGSVGGLGGTAGFLTAATNVPAIFGGYDARSLSQALQDAIGLDVMVWNIALTTFVALLVGVWTTQRNRP